MSGGAGACRTVVAFTVLVLAALAVLPASTAAAHSIRYTNAKRLNAGLAGTPLARLGFQFEAAGWRWNINPFLVAAIAGTESSFGKAACGGNAWGIGSCGTSFVTFREGLWYTTRLLRLHYLDDGLVTLVQVGTRYAACGPCWAAHTLRFMQWFDAGPPLDYPGRHR